MRRSVLGGCIPLILSVSLMAQIPGAVISNPQLSPAIYPRYLAAAGDGVWFTDERFTPHKIGFFTRSGTVSLFEIPCDGCADGSRITYIESITNGPDGNAWFLYTRVASDGSPIDAGMNNYVGRVTRQGVFTSFPVPTKDAFRRYIFGAIGHAFITTGPDGALWFTENAGNKIGRISTAGSLTEFALPAGMSFPSGITTGPDGNLWIAVTFNSRILKMTPAGAFTTYSLANSSFPISIIRGPDDNLWFTGSARIGRITTAGAITIIDLPNQSPPHLIAAPDGNLWFTSNNRTLGRLRLPLPAAGPPTIESVSLAPNTPWDLVFTEGASSISSTAAPALPASSVPAPALEASAQLRPTPETNSSKRRAVTPRSTLYKGRVMLALTMSVDDALRATLQQSPQVLAENGLTLTPEGLRYPTTPAMGFRVTVGDETAMTTADGVFFMATAPQPNSTGMVSNHSGRITKSFRAEDFIVTEGKTPNDIEVALTLSSGPNGMNDYPPDTASLHAGHIQPHTPDFPPDLGFPCGSHAGCTRQPCPPGRCCLDYNGWCADNPLTRVLCNPLRVQQYLGSTCGKWVNLGCCINEGAIVNGFGGNGPGCFDNHAGRECQDLDPTKLALQLGVGDHSENKPVPDVRQVYDYEENFPPAPRISVPCGKSIELYDHNNTCWNESDISINSTVSRIRVGVWCVAGGSLSPTGRVPHFVQVKSEPVSTESTGAFRHIIDQVLVYTAPSSIGADCNQKGTDIIRSEAGSRVRYLAIDVDCSKGVQPPGRQPVPPTLDPPPGTAQDKPFEVTVTTTDTGVTIRYTTDGTIPTNQSPQIANGGKIPVSGSTTIRARAYTPEGQAGPVEGGNFDVFPAMTASINPAAGKYPCEPLKVVVGSSPTVNGAKTSFTTNGSEPSETTAQAGQRFEITINPPGPVTVKAQAFAPYRSPSAVTSATYTFDCPTAGVFDVWISESDPEFHDLLGRARFTPPN